MSHQNTLSGLIISKQGIQAVASDDTVSGLICLKVSLPLERGDRMPNKFPLFSGDNAPPLLGPPEIHSLPLKNPSSPLLRTASRLLNLTSSYPPTQPILAARPSIEVSKSTGQVYVVLESRRAGGRRETLIGKEGRREWLILIRFQLPITQHGHANIVSLGLPKCLDNVFRFQILTPHASSSSDTGEVNVTTEPKVRPVSSSTFHQSTVRPRASRPITEIKTTGRARGVGEDEGWEDGEDMGLEGVYTDEEDETEQTEEDSDTEGSWLEGRFPSTDILRLEWTFGAPLATASWLDISPTYNKRSSQIHVQYQSLPLPTGTTHVEAVIPDGWGWSSLSIRGESLVDWTSADGDWWAEPTQRQGVGMLGSDESGATQVEDSFSTTIQRLRPSTPNRASFTPSSVPTRSPNNAYYSVNLLKQKIPSHLSKMEDFSFEMSHASMETARPYTPISKPSTPSPSFGQPSQLLQSSQADITQSKKSRRPVNGPAPARLFDLALDSPGHFNLEGTLVPISRLTHVSPSLPLNIPFIRLDGQESAGSAHNQCEVTCTGSALQKQLRILDTARASLGTFQWSDDGPQAVMSSTVPIKSDVDIRLTKDTWGLISMLIAFPWPKRATEVGFALCSSEMRLVKATIAGESMPRSFTTIDGSTCFRFSSDGTKGAGRVEIALDLRGEDEIPLPRFEGVGKVTVNMVGNQWDLAKRHIKSNMIRTSDSIFTYDLASPSFSTLEFTSAGSTSSAASGTGARRGLLSWSTLINLFLVWILISLAIQVQRLRNEVAFVAEEAKDLRLFGLATSATTASETFATYSADTSSASSVNFDTTTLWSSKDPRPTSKDADIPHRDKRGDVKTSLGRVVFGRSAWDKWATHPTSIGMGIGKGIGWVWQSVVWLVNPL